MNRRDFLRSSGAAVAGSLAAAGPLGCAEKVSEGGGEPMRTPNILMITCHDIGQHLGCYGVETVRTDNLDKLASRGVRFANLHSTSAVCSPGRGSLHTGRYPQSNGLMGLTHAPWWWRLNEGERHTAAILRDIGYATHLVGFNHVHGDARRLGYEKVHSKKRKAPETVQAASDLIRSARKGGRPFFAKVGFFEVHRPFTHGSDEEKGVFIPPWLKDVPDVRSDLAAFQATIRYFDQLVGEILDTLEASDVAEDTMVVMTSDHGMPYPGAKWSVRKAGTEVPLILHQPGTPLSGGRVFTELMSNVDVLPTLLDLLGAPVPGNIEGRSFKALIEGESKAAPRKEAFSQYTPDMKRDNLSRSVITERYHLIRYFEQGRPVDYPVDVHPQEFAGHVRRCKTRGMSPRPFAQLFDIKDDPYELTDIGSKEESAPVVADLSGRMLAWMRRVGDPLLEGPLRTPYYDKAVSDLMKSDG